MKGNVMRRTLVLLLLLASAASAQNGGSILSRFGIGDLDPALTSRQRGMGGAASALESQHDISLSNPAQWTGINGLRLQGGGLFEFEQYSKGSNLAYGSTIIKGFKFALPIEESTRLRLVTGFLPVSRVGYELRGTGTVSGETYRADYTGSGGVSQFSFGAAFKPASFLSLGASYRFLFGTIEREQHVVFDNTTLFGSTQRQTTSHNGSGFTVGALVAFPSLLEDLSIGVSVSPAMSLTATRNYTFRYSTHDSTVAGETGTQDIPLRFSVGVSQRIGKRLLAAIDFSSQDWNNAIVFDGVPGNLTATTRFGAGLEWQNNDPDLPTAAARAVFFRLGFYQQTGYALLDGEKEKDTFITLGAGVPILGINRVDGALEIGWRGSADQTLGSRMLVRFALSVSVGESWFVRRDAE
jgi:hypothetical protein